MKLTFKKLDPGAVIPSRATPGSAGLDLCACLDAPVTLEVGEIKMIPIGITAQPDSDYHCFICCCYSAAGNQSRHRLRKYGHRTGVPALLLLPDNGLSS